MGLDTRVSGELLPELAALPGHVFWRAAARVAVTLDDALPPGVDIHGYAALVGLADGASYSQQQLADLLDVSRTTMAKVAATLTEAGLVSRTRDPADRRRYVLRRTPAGTETARRWRRYAERVERDLSAHLSPEDREALGSGMQRLLVGELDPGTPPVLLESLAFLITRIHLRLYAALSRAFAPLGIEPRHFGSLVALEARGPVTQATLARFIGVSGASVVHIVDELEEHGLVERRRDPGDRRTQILHLRPGTTAVIARAVSLQGPIEERLDRLGADREAFLGALRRFVAPGQKL